jgi:hypothetical protein
LAQYQAGDHVFEVRDRGSRLFAYVLLDHWYRISVASKEALSSLDWLDAEPCVRRPVETGRPPSDERLFVHGLSAITTHMPREGIFDPEEAYRNFWDKARTYHNARAEVTGLLFADDLIKKARSKARQYNSANNREAFSGPDPVTQAVARAYKKQRDG